jgi:Fe-S-cluster containining protein
VAVDSNIRRFACTQCGKCCNRSPEVELSEAAALADVFVFRLMFRLYWLPNQLSDYAGEVGATANRSAVFYERKRLLGAFAARKFPAKVRRNGKAVDYTKYLMISALAVDTTPGACSALNGTRCGIHRRRPLSCQSVPFHYSRGEATAEGDLAAFVATSEYQCDTGATADAVLSDGKIVGPGYSAVRDQAISLAGRDRAWASAIVRQMKGGPLPTLEEIEANAQFAATTISMRVAWQIAADAGLIATGECERLTQLQLQAIDRELASGRCSRDACQTLMEMRAEYRRANQGIVR